MRLSRLHLIALAGVIPFAMSSVPTHAEDNGGFLGQAQRFLNSGNQEQQNAYERGRQDEARRETLSRQQWRDRDEDTTRTTRRYPDRDRMSNRDDWRSRDNRPYRPAENGDRDD